MRSFPHFTAGRGGGLLALGAMALAGSAFIVNRRSKAAEAEHPPLGRFVTAGGVRLHYVEAGSPDARPVVFLHGNGGMCEDMLISGVVGAAARNFRAIVFDRPGFGHSERPRGRRWSAMEQALAVRDALAFLGIERAVIFGHSWGSLVALALALRDPGLVSGLVLASGYYFPTARADSIMFSPPAVPFAGDVLRYTIGPIAGELVAPRLVAKMFAPQPVPIGFKVEFPFSLALRPSQIKAFSEDSIEMPWSAAELWRRYGEIGCPVDILAGNRDRIVSFERQPMRLKTAIPHSVLHVIDGAGHMIHHVDPERCAASIAAVAARGT
jgi:pimeloyl-ACP methyl ester carboxylesterase